MVQIHARIGICGCHSVFFLAGFAKHEANASTTIGIAWALLLMFFPYITLPAYALVGRGKFAGYVKARRAGDSRPPSRCTAARGSVRSSTRR